MAAGGAQVVAAAAPPRGWRALWAAIAAGFAALIVYQALSLHHGAPQPLAAPPPAAPSTSTPAVQIPAAPTSTTPTAPTSAILTAAAGLKPTPPASSSPPARPTPSLIPSTNPPPTSPAPSPSPSAPPVLAAGLSVVVPQRSATLAQARVALAVPAGAGPPVPALAVRLALLGAKLAVDVP